MLTLEEINDGGDAIEFPNCTAEEWEQACDDQYRSLLEDSANQPDPALYQMMRQIDSGRYTVGCVPIPPTSPCLQHSMKRWV